VNLAQANLEGLLAKYYTGTAAHVAGASLGELILRGNDARLERLLRDHRQDSITEPSEIELRAATDRLLTCYAVLEISSIAHFISDVPDEFASEARTVLGNRHVRRYYESYYPTKLPRRLTHTGPVVHEGNAAAATRAMMSFLELDRQFTEKLEEKTLLKMLDSFTIGERRFRDLVELIGTPQTFVDHLMLHEGTDKVLALAAIELGLFLQFCVDLRNVLLGTRDAPLLQSAIWTHYGYWFDILGEALNRKLDAALSRFLEWKVPDGANDEASRELQAYVGRARGALAELTSGRFSNPINQIIYTS
jgi:hypothetical protein